MDKFLEAEEGEKITNLKGIVKCKFAKYNLLLGQVHRQCPNLNTFKWRFSIASSLQ